MKTAADLKIDADPKIAVDPKTTADLNKTMAESSSNAVKNSQDNVTNPATSIAHAKSPQLSDDWIIKGNPDELVKSKSQEVVIYEKKIAVPPISADGSASNPAAGATSNASANTSNTSAGSLSSATAATTTDSKGSSEAIAATSASIKVNQEQLVLTHVIITRKNHDKEQFTQNTPSLPLKLNLYFKVKTDSDLQSELKTVRSRLEELLSSIPGLWSFIENPYMLIPGTIPMPVNMGDMTERMMGSFFKLLIENNIFTSRETDYFQSLFECNYPTKYERETIQRYIDKREYNKAIALVNDIYKTALDSMTSDRKLDISGCIFYDLGIQLMDLSPKDAIQAFELIPEFKHLYPHAIEKICQIYTKMCEAEKLPLGSGLETGQKASQQREAQEKLIQYLQKLFPYTSTTSKEKRNKIAVLFANTLEKYAGVNITIKERLIHIIKKMDVFNAANISGLLIALSNKLYENNKIDAHHNSGLPSNTMTVPEEWLELRALEELLSVHEISYKFRTTLPNENKNTSDLATSAVQSPAIGAITENPKSLQIQNKSLSDKDAADLKEKFQFQEWEVKEGDLLKLKSEKKSGMSVWLRKKAVNKNIPATKETAEKKPNPFDISDIVIQTHKRGIFIDKKPIKIGQAITELNLVAFRNPALPIIDPINAIRELHRDTKSLADRINQNIVGIAHLHNPFFEFRDLSRQMPSGSIVSAFSLDFRVEALREPMADRFFEALIDENIISKEDAKIFKAICGHRDPSKEEMELRIRIQEYLKKAQDSQNFKYYDEIIRTLKTIHYSAVSEIQERSFEQDSAPMDDVTLAYEVGEELTAISPPHAIAAFRILVVFSPLYHQAQDQIAQLLFGLSCDLKKSEVLRRGYQQAAIQHLCKLKNMDEHQRLQLCTLLAMHAGSMSSGLDNPLFGNMEYQKDSFSNIFISLLLTMANALWECTQNNVDIASKMTQTLQNFFPTATSNILPIIFSYLRETNGSFIQNHPNSIVEITESDILDTTVNDRKKLEEAGCMTTSSTSFLSTSGLTKITITTAYSALSFIPIMAADNSIQVLMATATSPPIESEINTKVAQGGVTATAHLIAAAAATTNTNAMQNGSATQSHSGAGQTASAALVYTYAAGIQNGKVLVELEESSKKKQCSDIPSK